MKVTLFRLKGEIMSDLIKVQNLTKTYKRDSVENNVLKNISFNIKANELTLILGASGSGKSTLLNILGGLEKSTNGSVIVDCVDITGLNNNQLAEYRAKKVGFIFQSYNLLPSLNVRDNVSIVKEISKEALDTDLILEQVGLGNRGKDYPSLMSGGEQQRVSIARAIAKNTPILLCDEPTGTLDTENGYRIMNLLKDLTEKGKTVIVVTHNLEYTKYADKIINLKDGNIVDNIGNMEA